MKIHVFLGPTLSIEHASQYLDATYHAPVQQGEVLSVLRDQPDILCIIDGYFEGVPSVWHKEILAALSAGIHVFGAASLGALRASELHSFGMVGIGRIFEQYKSGAIEDDDEVAVRHASAEFGFRQLSEAMVNMRDAFETAAEQGIVSAAVAARLVEIAKRMHYADRCYPLVLEAARQQLRDFPGLEELEAFVRSSRLTLKQRDAIELLQQVSEFAQRTPGPFLPSFRLEHTTFLDALYKDITLPVAQDKAEPPAIDRRTYNFEDLESVDLAFLRVLARQHAQRIGLQLSAAESGELSSQVAPKLSAAGAPGGFLENRSAMQLPFSLLMSDICLIEKLRRIYQIEITQSLNDQMALAGACRKSGG